MKYVVYILTAMLAAAAVAAAAVAALLPLINLLSAMQETNLRVPDYTTGYWTDVVLMAAVAAMAVVQLFRSTPRLMLLFAGAAAYIGISLLIGQGIPTMVMAAGQSLPDTGAAIITLMLSLSLLMMAAGLLPALYEWIRHGRLVKAQPKRNVKRGLLITAGVLACVNLALSLVRMASQISWLAAYDEALMYLLPGYIFGVLFDIGLLVTCFMMKRRTGALYRMFFAGTIALSAVTLPLTVASQLQMGMDIAGMAANFVISAVAILTAVFAIVHAAKHRHEDFAPPILTPPPYDNPAASAAA